MLVKHHRTCRYWSIVVSIVVAFGCAPEQKPNSESADDALAALQLIMATYRPHMPRLSGSDAWLPCAEPARVESEPLVPGCNSVPSTGTPQFEAIEVVHRQLISEQHEPPSARTHHAAGIWHLLWATQIDGEIDQAIDSLENALQLDATKAEIHSDLAAALLVRASSTSQAADLANALDTIDRAWRLDPSSATIGFNRQLILGLLFLDHRTGANTTFDGPSDIHWSEELISRFETVREKVSFDPPHADATSQSTLDQVLAFYAESRYPEALRTLRAAEVDQHSSYFRGQFAYLQGLIHGIRGDHSEALRHARRAAAEFQTAGFINGQCRSENLLSSSSRDLGDFESAWHHAHRGLHCAKLSDSKSARYNARFEAGQLARVSHSSRSALYFFDEMVEISSEIGPIATSGALRTRAIDLFALGEHQAALADLSRARRAIETLPASDPTRPQLLADLLLAEGEIQIAIDPGRAIDSLDQAVEAILATNYGLTLPRAYRFRARAHLEVGSKSTAEADLRLAITHLEQQRSDLDTHEQRRSFASEQRSVYETMITLQLSLGKAGAAFNFSEALRTTQLGPLSSESRDHREIEHMSAGLGADRALVSYLIRGSTIEAWVFTDQQFEYRIIDLPASQLRDQVAEFHTLLLERSGEAATLGRLELLYDQLIAPLTDVISPKKELVLVLDGALESVPFAALRNRETGHFLVQDHLISRALQATRSADPEARPAPSRSSILLVADPDINQQLFDLPSLPHARDEIERIAEQVPNHQRLLGSAATPTRVIDGLQNHSQAHFAVHALTSPAAGLVLSAPSDPASDSGMLAAHEISTLDLRHSELVVLSACRTYSGRPTLSGSSIGLGPAFLAAGVDQVIATLWEVEDSFSADFLPQVHRRIRDGSNPQEALRQTQLKAIRYGVHPFAWAAYTLIN